MLRIRLRRIGKRHTPIFSVVVAEHKRAVKGDFIEKLGTYNAVNKTLIIKKDRLKHWQDMGAQLSDTMHNILVREKVIKAKAIKKTVEPKKEEEKTQDKSEEQKTESVQESPKPVKEIAVKEEPKDSSAPEEDKK